MAEAQLTFRALGPLEARLDGEPVDLGPAKQRALLGVLLALAPDTVPVERLVDELWPEGGPGQPLRSLQVYVSALRRALAREAGRLLTADRGYRMELPSRGLDTVVFDELAAACSEQRRRGAHEAAAHRADTALGLWRGGAWQDLLDVPVLAAEATRLEKLRVDVEALRAGALLDLGRHREQVPTLESLVARHPFREDLRGQLMLALHRSGRQSDALEVFASGRRLLAEETGLDPGAALRAIHAGILDDHPRLRVEDADLRSRRHLPAPATPLVGRRRDREELSRLVADGTRLLTLTGPGGVGKTRLALHVAHVAAADCTDGVWFVDLADLDDPGLVAPAVVDALGLDPAGDEPTTVLTEHVAHRRLLLVLDNFEQVEEAAGLVPQLLAAGDGVQVLVTSRVPLRVYGEHVRQLQPMDPDDAVLLFTARATAADHRFQPDRAGTVERICAALDRLPLALELAAARVADMSLLELADRLDERLELASDGPRERAGRQRELRATIAWSVDLLPATAAHAFARLGAFSGGFQADAAVAVGVSRAQLETLVRFSLVVREGERFRMLETIRDYAVELLAALPDRAAVVEQHAAYHLALAEQAHPGTSGATARALIARLRSERANLRAAMEHYERSEAWLELLRMTTALTVFWYRTGVREDDVAWLELALARAPGADDHLRGRALYGLAICRGEQGRSVDAMVACRESHRLLQRTGDESWLARVLNSLAALTRDAGHAAEAAPMIDEVIALRRRLADPGLSLRIPLHNRALVALDLGDLETARRCLTEERQLVRGDEMDEAWTDSTLADLALDEGDVEGAKALLAHAVPVLRHHDAEPRLIELLDTFAALAARLGRPAEAALLVGAADGAVRASGAVQVPADLMLRQRRVGAALATLDPAERARLTQEGAALSLADALSLGLDVLG